MVGGLGEELVDKVGASGEGSRLRLVGEFAAFGPAYMRWVKSRLGEGGPTYARMRLLGVLRCRGPQIMSGLSGELGVTPRNVTALVDALEEDGLVRRKPHPTDRRATVIEMTGRGESTCESAFAGHADAVGELFDDLSEEERRELLGALAKLRGALRRRGISGC